ncbi:MAG: hypothetical protein K5622_06840, partial [Endomicrobiaceae bacterium]|nr:hypothetical protein [Endomicrobiaceae bacterium]
ALLLSIIYLFVEKFVIVRNPKFYIKQETDNRQNINRDNVIDVEGVYEDDNKAENFNNKRLED